jgi:hypothetical protein
MRASVLSLLPLSALLLAPPAGLGDETPPSGTEAVPVEAAKAEPKAFVPPDGWKPKKRGQFTVYCRKQSQQGTRVPKEVCYDEEGIRAMLAAQREDREKVDQMRRVCGSQAACGSN